MFFKNRQEVVREIVKRLITLVLFKPYIFALPRGGVVVGYEVSKALNAPLDVIVARKLGVPSYPELGFGAIAPSGIIVIDQEIASRYNITQEIIDDVAELETIEMERRIELYRQNHNYPNLQNRTAILVDDGIATGVTAIAAIKALRNLNPREVILASPVAPADIIKKINPLVNKLICLDMPLDFGAVGQYYLNFDQVTDTEVVELLEKSKKLD